MEDQLKKEFQKYRDFYVEFNYFLKEGACQDFKYQEQIAKLLMYETSKGEEDQLSTLEQYISRCSPEQKNIYYLVAPNRQAAFDSPYYETFKKHDKEVCSRFILPPFHFFDAVNHYFFPSLLLIKIANYTKSQLYDP